MIAERVRQEVGALVYLPNVRHVLCETGKRVLGPLYMTYVFVDIDQGPPWQAIRRTPGVDRIVMSGEKPPAVPKARS